MARTPGACFLLLFLWYACNLASATDLVTYFKFDEGSGSTTYSSQRSCPNTTPVLSATVSKQYGWVANGKFKSALKFDSSPLDIGDFKINSENLGGQFSISAWIKPYSLNPSNKDDRNIVYKYDSWRFYINVHRGGSTELACSFTSTYTRSVSTYVSFNYNNWEHVACTYNRSSLCLWRNGDVIDCSSAEATLYESDSTAYIGGRHGNNGGGDGNDLFNGELDEITFWSKGLNAAEIKALATRTSSFSLPLPPNVTSTTFPDPLPPLLKLPILDNLTLALSPNFTPEFPFQDELQYKWYANTASCGSVEASSYNESSIDLSFNDFSTVSVGCCIDTGIFVAQINQVNVQIIPSSPVILTEPAPIVIVEYGKKTSLTVIVDSKTPSTFQWQQLREINGSSHSNDTGTLVKRGDNNLYPYDDFEEQEIISDEFGQIFLQTTKQISSTLTLVTSQVIHFHNENLYSEDSSEENIYTLAERQVSVFSDIPGANSNIWTTPAADDDLNGTVVRCVLTNQAGVAYTKEITLILNPDTSYTNDSSNDTLGLTLGIILGLFCCCCFIISLIIFAIIFIFIKKRNSTFKLKEPNYNQIVFGSSENKDSEYIIKENQKIKLLELKKLLFAKDNLLAHICLNICPQLDGNNFSSNLITVFQAEQKGVEIINERVEIELSMMSDEQTIFRHNSIAMRLYSNFVKFVALNYLWNMLAVPVNALNHRAKEKDKNLSCDEISGDRNSVGSSVTRTSKSFNFLEISNMEVDPNKIEDVQDQTINTLELWLTAQKLFAQIVKNKQMIPRSLVEIMQNARKNAEKFGCSEATIYISMGNFFWLRCVCPALMAPHMFGILPEAAHRVAQRQYLLVAKVLQNLANNSLPGNKEHYMEKLNEFISENRDTLQDFYDGLDNDSCDWQLDIPDNAVMNSLAYLHEWILSKEDEIETELLGEDDEVQSEGAKIWQKLQEILIEMPKPCKRKEEMV